MRNARSSGSSRSCCCSNDSSSRTSSCLLHLLQQISQPFLKLSKLITGIASIEDIPERAAGCYNSSCSSRCCSCLLLLLLLLMLHARSLGVSRVSGRRASSSLYFFCLLFVFVADLSLPFVTPCCGCTPFEQELQQLSP